MHEEVRDALKSARRDPAVRCLMITGNGRGFCAGQDLSDRNVAAGSERPDLGLSIEQYYNPMIRALRSFPAPVICAVNGVAADAAMALENARELYTRRSEGVSLWVVPSAQITASSPDEKEPLFDPSDDKVYRHATFYDLPKDVGHM
jgi:phenylacetate-CoA oxygenase PaaH subunit